jgi:hypothetical protein
VAPDRYYSLSGAPLVAALTSARTVHALLRLQVSVAVDRCAVSRCSAWCTGQSGGTPDSPVNYSGVALEKPEGEEFGVVRSWCTGQSGAPDQGILGFLCSFFLNPLFNLFIGL